MDDVPAIGPHPIHGAPLDAEARIRMSRLARVLGIRPLFTEDGRLYRQVAVYRGRLRDLLSVLILAGFWPKPLDAPGTDILVMDIDGIALYPVRGHVLIGEWEDIRETLDIPGRLDAIIPAPRTPKQLGGYSYAERRI